MHNFKDLNVWQEAIYFAKDIYQITDKFPSHEKFGMCSQIQRAAVSISCNISEGSSKKSKKDFARFLGIALGSSNEVENLLILSNLLEYISKEEFKELEDKIKEIQKMLVGLINSLV